MCRTKAKDKKGLTLLEILLVVSLLSVVSLAVYSTFSSGLQIWQKLTQRRPSEKVSIFFEKIAEDLRNCFSFTDVPFMGLENRITFATLVLTPGGREEETLSVGRAEYYYNPAANALERLQSDYSQVYEHTFSPPRSILEEIVSFGFEFYYYDQERKTHKWKDDWFEEDEDSKIPLAVKVTVRFIENEEEKKAEKTIAIPAAAQYHYLP